MNSVELGGLQPESGFGEYMHFHKVGSLSSVYHDPHTGHCTHRSVSLKRTERETGVIRSWGAESESKMEITQFMKNNLKSLCNRHYE